MINLQWNKGFSLTELIVVIAIIFIFLTIAIPAISNWINKYNIEAQIRQIYGELTTVRAQAMFRNRNHCVLPVTAREYQVVDDVNNLGQPLCANGVVLRNVNLKYAVASSAGLAAGLSFNARGISSVAEGNTEAVCVPSDAQPDYDCIRIGPARMQLGKLTAQGGCNGDICQPK